MATKTISIELDVYEQLRALRASPSESFSQVLRRELGKIRGLPATELLRRARQPGGILGLSEESLQLIEQARADNATWDDAWTR